MTQVAAHKSSCRTSALLQQWSSSITIAARPRGTEVSGRESVRTPMTVIQSQLNQCNDFAM